MTSFHEGSVWHLFTVLVMKRGGIWIRQLHQWWFHPPDILGILLNSSIAWELSRSSNVINALLSPFVRVLKVQKSQSKIGLKWWRPNNLMCEHYKSHINLSSGNLIYPCSSFLVCLPSHNYTDCEQEGIKQELSLLILAQLLHSPSL